MDCVKPPLIDLQQAAERLLDALSFIAGKLPERPVPAIQLCTHAFDADLRRHWNHETRRRRVREAVAIAREILVKREHELIIAASGAGYWLTGDRKVMTWYAHRRRQRGVKDLVAGRQSETVAQDSGQPSLFGSPEPIKPRCRYD